MKKVLFILSDKDFRDGEYLVPRAFFEKSEIEVFTASKTGNSVGHFGFSLKNDFKTDEIKGTHYDAIFFVGGMGCIQYLEDNHLNSEIKQMLLSGKVVASICLAPRLFLKWGVLKDKAFTGWNDDLKLDHLANEANAFFKKGEICVCDGKIVTGSGIEATESVAKKIIEFIH